MRNWERERWRKLYLGESLAKGLWLLFARALESYLVKRGQDDGTLLRVAAGADPFDALLDALRAHPDEREIARESLLTLYDDGFIEFEPQSGRLWVVNLPAAQGDEELDKAQPRAAGRPRAERPMTGAERARLCRANKRASRKTDAERNDPSRKTQDDRNENRNENPVTTVTKTSRVLSQDLSSGSVETSQKNEKEESENRARSRNENRNETTDEERNDERDANSVTRKPGQRPTARANLINERINPAEMQVPAECAEYALELGLTSEQYDRVIADFRQKTAPATFVRLVDMVCRFIEAKVDNKTAGARRPAVRGAQAPRQPDRGVDPFAKAKVITGGAS